MLITSFLRWLCHYQRVNSIALGRRPAIAGQSTAVNSVRAAHSASGRAYAWAHGPLHIGSANNPPISAVDSHSVSAPSLDRQMPFVLVREIEPRPLQHLRQIRPWPAFL